MLGVVINEKLSLKNLRVAKGGMGERETAREAREKVRATLQRNANN
jgi:hypothetical protein